MNRKRKMPPSATGCSAGQISQFRRKGNGNIFKNVAFIGILLLTTYSFAYIKTNFNFYNNFGNGTTEAFRRDHQLELALDDPNSTLLAQYNWLDKVSGPVSTHDQTIWQFRYLTKGDLNWTMGLVWYFDLNKAFPDRYLVETEVHYATADISGHLGLSMEWKEMPRLLYGLQKTILSSNLGTCALYYGIDDDPYFRYMNFQPAFKVNGTLFLTGQNRFISSTYFYNNTINMLNSISLVW